jgi:type VI secretion system secreted protein Hcp
VAVAGHFKKGESMDDTKNRSTTRIGHHLLVGALAAGATIGATSADAAIDIFLKIQGIDGESTNSKHKGEIDVLSWSWGASAGAADKKGSLTPGCSDSFNIVKNVDKATPSLVTSLALGTTIPSAILTVTTTGETAREVLKVNLAGVTVKSLSDSVASGADTVREQLSLAFTSAMVTYKPQNPDGTAGAAVNGTVPTSCP